MTSYTAPTGPNPPAHTEDVAPPTYTEDDPEVASGIDQTTGSNDPVTGSSPDDPDASVPSVNHAANILLALAEHDGNQPSPVPVPPYPRPFVPHPNPGSPSDSRPLPGDLPNDPQGGSSAVHQDATTKEGGETTADSSIHALVEKTKTLVVEIDSNDESGSDGTLESDSPGSASHIDNYVEVTAHELGLDGDNLGDTTQAALQELNRVGGLLAAELQHSGSEREQKELAQRGLPDDASNALYAEI